MDELEQKIMEIMDDPNMCDNDVATIEDFISKCSLSDFERLKDMEYDVTTKDT
jgi:hypothetical protein